MKLKIFMFILNVWSHPWAFQQEILETHENFSCHRLGRLMGSWDYGLGADFITGLVHWGSRGQACPSLGGNQIQEKEDNKDVKAY